MKTDSILSVTGIIASRISLPKFILQFFLKSDNEETLKKARAQRDALLKEAREMKQGLIDEAKDEANQEAKKIINQAQETIESEKNAAISDLKKQVANLSVEIAEKVLKEKLSDDQSQMKLINDLVKDAEIK